MGSFIHGLTQLIQEIPWYLAYQTLPIKLHRSHSINGNYSPGRLNKTNRNDAIYMTQVCIIQCY